MTATPVANGHTPGPDLEKGTQDSLQGNVNNEANGHPETKDSSAPKRPRKKKGKNYNALHAKPLPLEIHPLPAFHPSNPISLLRLCYVWLSHAIFPPTSSPVVKHTGIYDPDSRSVHVTDPTSIRALWEMGFFGKGSLSRSEPSWLEREKARVKAERAAAKAEKEGRRVEGGGTAEEATLKRREERRLFKLERARVEREKIELQRAFEEGRVGREEFERLSGEVEGKVEDGGSGADVSETETNGQLTNGAMSTEKTSESIGRVSEAQMVPGSMEPMPEPHAPLPEALQTSATQLDEVPLLNGIATAPMIPTTAVKQEDDELDSPEPAIRDQEHLQLTPTEAFFLSYALGVLQITVPPPNLSDSSAQTYQLRSPPHPNNSELLSLFCHQTATPPIPAPNPTLNIPKPTIAVNDQVLHARAISHAISTVALNPRLDPTASALAVPADATPNAVFSPGSPEPLPLLWPEDPENPFLVNYVVYHHFRSLGWVVRPGVKFGVDYLLYNRGPVFSHAEFGVLILPAYTDGWWETAAGRERRSKGSLGGREEGKDWWWLHCVNRVQSQVRKSLVVVYVDVPPPMGPGKGEGDIGMLLRRYKVREFVVRRWVGNRMRE